MLRSKAKFSLNENLLGMLNFRGNRPVNYKKCNADGTNEPQQNHSPVYKIFHQGHNCY